MPALVHCKTVQLKNVPDFNAACKKNWILPSAIWGGIALDNVAEDIRNLLGHERYISFPVHTAKMHTILICTADKIRDARGAGVNIKRNVAAHRLQRSHAGAQGHGYAFFRGEGQR